MTVKKSYEKFFLKTWSAPCKILSSTKKIINQPRNKQVLPLVRPTSTKAAPSPTWSSTPPHLAFSTQHTSFPSINYPRRPVFFKFALFSHRGILSKFLWSKKRCAGKFAIYSLEKKKIWFKHQCLKSVFVNVVSENTRHKQLGLRTFVCKILKNVGRQERNCIFINKKTNN